MNAASKLAEVVSQQTQSIEEEQSKIRDADPLAKIEAMKKQSVSLPWEDLNVDDPAKLSALTQQILSLAKVVFFSSFPSLDLDINVDVDVASRSREPSRKILPQTLALSLSLISSFPSPCEPSISTKI